MIVAVHADRRSIAVVGAALIREGRCLVTRRGPGQDQPGRWEFPGGKLEPGETPREALVRELAEELGIAAEVGELLGRGEATIGDRRIRLRVFEARWTEGRIRPRQHDRYRWVGPGELGELRWARADLPLLPRVAERLRRDGSDSEGTPA